MNKILKCLIIIFNLLNKLYTDIKYQVLHKIMLHLAFCPLLYIQSPYTFSVFIVSFITMANFFYLLRSHPEHISSRFSCLTYSTFKNHAWWCCWKISSNPYIFITIGISIYPIGWQPTHFTVLLLELFAKSSRNN